MILGDPLVAATVDAGMASGIKYGFPLGGCQGSEYLSETRTAALLILLALLWMFHTPSRTCCCMLLWIGLQPTMLRHSRARWMRLRP